jgi:hypothetical protein
METEARSAAEIDPVVLKICAGITPSRIRSLPDTGSVFTGMAISAVSDTRDDCLYHFN